MRENHNLNHHVFLFIKSREVSSLSLCIQDLSQICTVLSNIIVGCTEGGGGFIIMTKEQTLLLSVFDNTNVPTFKKEINLRF